MAAKSTKKRNFDNTNSSNEDDTAYYNKTTPSNKKRALKQERQSNRRHANAIQNAKEIWNQLRIKSNTPEMNTKLVTQLFELLRGKMMDVAMQHDSSRIVQSVIQFGDGPQRLEVVKELTYLNDKNAKNGDSSGAAGNGNSAMNLSELCKIQYAHFVVLKMIKYCARDEECVRLIVKSLRKQMNKLAVHAVGARVVELLFDTFSSKSILPLKLELYGPQYALFAATTPDKTDSSKDNDKNDKNTQPQIQSLTQFVKLHPSKKASTLQHLQTLLQKGIDKSLYGFYYFQKLLCDYVTIASPMDIQNSLTPSLADHTLHLMSTRSGCKVVAEMAAYGTVKDRKKMVKSLKGYARSSLLHRDAYLALLRLLDVCDDTRLSHRNILDELLYSEDGGGNSDHDDDQGNDDVTEESKGSKQRKGKHDNNGKNEAKDDETSTSPLLDVILSDTGSKLFLLLMAQPEKLHKYFDPYELSILTPNPPMILQKNTDGNATDNIGANTNNATENGIMVPTSKKPVDVRRNELLAYMQELLLDVSTNHAPILMKHKAGSRVLLEVCQRFPNTDLFTAIVDACSLENDDSRENGDDENKPDKKKDDDKSELSMLEHPIGHLTLKHLFLSESKRFNDNDNDQSNDDKEDEPSLAKMFYTQYHTQFETIASCNRGAFVLSALIQVPLVKKDVISILKKHKNAIAALAKGKGKKGKKGDKGKKGLAGCQVLLDALK